MPVKRDYEKGKNYEGPVFGGEKKDTIDSKEPYEQMGVHRSAPNPKLRTEGGFTSGRDGKEEAGFSLDAKGYAGPQNWKPTNLGDRDPDQLEHGA